MDSRGRAPARAFESRARIANGTGEFNAAAARELLPRKTFSPSDLPTVSLSPHGLRSAFQPAPPEASTNGTESDIIHPSRPDGGGMYREESHVGPSGHRISGYGGNPVLRQRAAADAEGRLAAHGLDHCGSRKRRMRRQHVSRGGRPRWPTESLPAGRRRSAAQSRTGPPQGLHGTDLPPDLRRMDEAHRNHQCRPTA